MFGFNSGANIAKINQLMYQYGDKHVRSLGLKLHRALEPACIQVLGDSTGNETYEWVYLLTQWLATNYPAYSVGYRLWNNDTQSYNGKVNLSTGSAGDAYVTFPGGTGNAIYAPDTTGLRVTGDLEIIAHISAADYTAAAVQTLVSKCGDAGARGYYMTLDTSGKVFLAWSTDGTALASATSTVALPVTDGEVIWVKATLDVDNGASGNTVKFYTSTDGTTWTQLGSAVTTAGTTSIYATTAQLEIGSRSSFGTTFTGKIYDVIIKAGIDGKIVASFDADQMHPSTIVLHELTSTDGEGNIYTANHQSVAGGNGSPGILIMNGSHGGANVAYSADVTRFALQTPIEPALTFISYGHNDEAGSVTAFQGIYEGLLSQVMTKYPNTGLVCIAQNPQMAPQDFVTQAKRISQVAKAAAKGNYGFIDVYTAFQKMLNYTATLINADGTHPTAAGQLVWFNEVLKFLECIKY